MEIKLSINFGVSAVRTGPGGPAEYKELELEIFKSLRFGMRAANAALMSAKVPFSLNEAKLEVVSR